ncbi:head GIN domain-containing protein [Sinomicrobium sp.]
MVKKTLLYLLVFWMFSCDSEGGSDCVKLAGYTVSREIDVAPFSAITAGEGVQVVIREDEEYSVVVKTGKNLIDDIKVEVKENRLLLSDETSCNLFREYDNTVVYVSAPALSEIRSSTQFDIRSQGVLTYPSLRIVSEDYGTDYNNTGNFYLRVENASISVLFNNLSNCYLSGTTEKLDIYLAAGNSRVEAEELTATEVNFYHRGSNDIVVNPTYRLKGDIYGTGNVIAVNKPELTEVQTHYRGELLFRE